ncbi:MAG: S8 family serine peptidase [Planctomycetes bacterium]|nr:S8 family serine peptidase [Planctomycetota bacterium]
MVSRPLFAAVAVWLSVHAMAQAIPGAPYEFAVQGVSVRRLLAADGPHADWSEDGGLSWRPLRQPDDRLHFRLVSFDPLLGVPSFPPPFGVPAASRLRLVQFHTQVLGAYREAVTAAGAEILHYLPANALFVRCDAGVAAALAALPCVRWIGGLPNACKLDPDLGAVLQAGGNAPVVCNLVLAAKGDRIACLQQVLLAGGQVVAPCEGSTMVRVALTPAQLLAVLDHDTVTWADLAGPDGFDMDNARVQGGANYIETMAAYRGQGVRIEVTESLEQSHPDLVGRVLVRGADGIDAHGHATAGIAAGSGATNPAARGLLPHAIVVEGSYTSATHYAQIQGSVDPVQPWRSMLATASWGAAQTTIYNSVSQAMDDALFDSDLTRVNSMGNNGNQLARPEAWAKNSISVGGIKHGNDALPGNDRWNALGDPTAASIGPASDGRWKPDAVGYYDSVLTTDLVGVAGYVAGDHVPNFGGTSAAAPMVAGHIGLLQQMFTDGLFGNPLPLPATVTNRFFNRPHMTTSKALLCNTARQYPFAGTTDDLTRTHQGWGFPDVRRAYDHRRSLVVVDEYDTLQLGETREYWVQILPGTPEFRVTMVYADPAGQPNAAFQLVNDLDLQVVRVADGLAWWGNHGLDADPFSKTGGGPNTRDNVETVCLANPVPGSYLVRVTAASVVQDGKVETPQLDVDYALVMHPVGGFRNDAGPRLQMIANAPGVLQMVCSNLPASGWTEGHTVISIDTGRGLGFGRFFGLEDDAVSTAFFQLPAAVGNPFHFLPGGSGQYPYATYTFDPGWVSWLASYNLTVDAVLLLWNGPEILAVSNVDRARLR